MKRKRPEHRAEPPPVCALAATRKAARLLTQLYDSYLVEHGIESAQFALLMTIEAAGSMGQRAVAQVMGMDKTTLSRNLKILQTRGWIVAEPGNDARSRKLVVTEDGRALLAKARPAWRRAQATLRKQLGAEAWQPLLDSLRFLSNSAVAATEHRQS